MVSCVVALAVLVPLLAVGVFYTLQPAKLEFEVEATVRASVEKTYNYLTDPEKLTALVPNINEIKVLEHSEVLDEDDGLFKHYYLVTVVEDLPHRSGVEFNFTRKASKEQRTVESQGEVIGILTYHMMYSVNENPDESVQIKEQTEMWLPRALLWLLSDEIKNRHQKLLSRLTEMVEKGEKVGQGTQTD